MANHIVYLSATTAQPYPLTIDSDGQHASTHEEDAALRTGVALGDTVTWQIKEDPNNIITSIVKIEGIFDQTSHDLFRAPGPHANPDGTWSGIIHRVGDPDLEKYDIHYTVKGRTEPYIEDPIIEVKPKKR